MEAATPNRRLDADTAIRTILEGTAAEVGPKFFDELVRHLAAALDTHAAWVSEFDAQAQRLRAIAFWAGEGFVEDYAYDVAGTPCEPSMAARDLFWVPEKVVELFPGDNDLRPMGAVSYLGVPLMDSDGETPLGHLAVIDRRPMAREPDVEAVVRIFAARAAAELRRLRAEETAHAATREADYLRSELTAAGAHGDLLGTSPAMQRVHQDIAQVAETDASVLILGETGTGKEVVARAIHAASPRAESPMIKLNCAAMPATLVESELFGHAKGAFTGATQARDGRFAMADGGTIFLDEVGELPLELQAKLLRVLQEGEFEPVGSGTTRRVDVRVVAATNRDLQAAIGEGTFREDLYYRLNVFPLELPPLRERGEDLRLLADAFAARLAARHGRALQPLTAACHARLTAYPWPGNVRELLNVLERAVITAQNGRLNLDRALPGAGADAAATGNDEGVILSAEEMRDFERRNIERALAACDGQIAGAAGAAARLGMNPSTLASRLKSLGIERPK
ncbi:MAG: sigma-54 interaction domain-containing protein [Planctomycetota bacterium]